MTADSAGERPTTDDPDDPAPATASSHDSTVTGSSTAATIGFVLAGIALAAAFLDWTPVVAAYGVPSLPGALTAGVALLALLARRHGTTTRSIALLALLAFVGVVVTAAAALLLPGLTGGPSPTAGAGVYLAMLAGVVGIGVAYADYVSTPDDAVLARVRDGLVATGIGVGGLLFAYLLTFSLLGLLGPLLPDGARNSVVTVVFSLGLGLVAAGYALQHPAGLSYFDVRLPDRRGWLYVVGGTVAMFVVLIVGGVVSTLLGLPSAEHGIIQQAQRNPGILLPLIPLSLLAIGPGEELLNRNVVQKHLYGSYSRYGAVLTATLVFTIIHVPAYGVGATPGALFVTLVRLFLISLVLGVVYERTRNVVVAALVHGGFDAIQFGAAYVLITRGLV